MSLQWTLVGAVLYAEMGVVFLLVLPFISVKKWQMIFRSRFLQVLKRQAQWYFGFIVVVLGLFLLDAIREIRKYSNKDVHSHPHTFENELQISMKLFRAQRNFYISGFSLFLSWVIHRFVSLISKHATLLAENEAVLNQAKSASATARQLLNSQAAGGTGEAADNNVNEAHQELVTKLEAKIGLLEDELEKAKRDKKAVVEQAKGLEAEYDRLNEEHRRLQLRVSDDKSSKKDE